MVSGLELGGYFIGVKIDILTYICDCKSSTDNDNNCNYFGDRTVAADSNCLYVCIIICYAVCHLCVVECSG